MSQSATKPVRNDLSGSSVGRYLMIERLGGGGMGEVYRAEDTKLKRCVAIKRVAPGLQGTVELRQRLLREAERASALQDPHVAAVYDVLEENEEVFLVMEYVAGQTLRQRLSRPLSLDEFLSLAPQCCRALETAHQHGILHGDIKPENIVISDNGNVKILDFGLARTFVPATVSRSEEATTTASRVLSGTPSYMAPEILLEKPTDQRVDIFSLGVVFYECLAGVSPFRADTFIATTDRILNETPVSLRVLNRAVPLAVEQTIFKMLAKEPEDRIATAQQARVALEATGSGATTIAAERHGRWAWLMSFLALLLIVVIVLMPKSMIQRITSSHTSVASMPASKHIAVLPFRSLSGDPGLEAFGSGLTETLAARLTQLTQRYPLQVVPSSEIRAQGIGTPEQARAVFGANLVLEGSLQQSGNTIRVVYGLVDTHTRRQLRADAVTASMGDIFAGEDRVVDGVLKMLDLELGSSERVALAARGTQQPAAYDFYLRGRGYLQEYAKPENIESAIAVFNRALALDRNYGLAYAGLGESYWRKYEHTHSPDWLKKATDACNTAVNLSPNAAAGYTCLGMVYNQTGNYQRAVEQFQRAQALDATSDDAYRGLAFAFESLNRFPEAETTYERAISVRPQYWAGYNYMGAFLLSRGRLREAASLFEQVIALAPDSYRGYSNLGAAYVLGGQWAKAIPVLQTSLGIRPTAAAFTNLGTAHFYLGQLAEAAQDFNQGVQLSPNWPVMWGNLGQAYYSLPGKRQEALTAFQRAVKLGEEHLQVNPKDATVLSQLGVYYALLQESRQATSYTERALEISRSPEILLRAGTVFAQLGNEERSLGYLEDAVAGGLSRDIISRTPFFDRLRTNPRFKALIQNRTTVDQATP